MHAILATISICMEMVVKSPCSLTVGVVVAVRVPAAEGLVRR